MSDGLFARARGWAEIACHAPSGDNSQPWEVSLKTEADRVILRLKLDAATLAEPSYFDCAFAASFLALGAYAQNFALMAAADGYAIQSVEEEEGQFTLVLAPGPVAAPPADIATHIRDRATNRNPFDESALDPAMVATLTEAVGNVAPGVTLTCFFGEQQRRLAGLFGRLDRLRYRSRLLYREFLDKLRFGAEATTQPDGLRDTTLGTPLPALGFLRGLRAARKVRVVHGLFFVGLERIMAFVGCSLLVRKAAAVGVLSGGDDTPRGWFELGRGFQQLWLDTTRLGLALQPLGTTLLLYRRERELAGRQASTLLERERRELHQLRDAFAAGYGMEFQRPSIVFRLGRCRQEAGRSLRRPLEL